MKFLALLISFSAMASNWMPASKISQGQASAFQMESSCVQASGEQCLDVGDEPQAVAAGFVSTQDKFSKAQVEECSDESDCQAKHEAKECIQGESIKNLDLMEVYCAVPAGKELVVDSAGFSSYKAAQAQAAGFAAAKEGAKKLRECGESVMDLLLVRNASKQPPLSTAQVKLIVGVYAPIKGLLETGSLATAKEEVEAVEPDGTLVTAEDKAAIIAAIDACLGG